MVFESREVLCNLPFTVAVHLCKYLCNVEKRCGVRAGFILIYLLELFGKSRKSFGKNLHLRDLIRNTCIEAVVHV